MLSNTYTDTSKILNSAFQKLDTLLFDSYLSKHERKVIVTIQSKGKHNAYGWCTTTEAWTDMEGSSFEINLSAEHLGRPMKDALETLVHEMVHLYNALEGVQDCSRKGTYHNKKFKVQAEKAGLTVEESEKYGWSRTGISDPLLRQLQDTFGMEAIEAPLGLERKDFKKSIKGGAIKKKTSFTYTCPSCGQSFKASNPDIYVKCYECDELMLTEQ